MSRRDGLVRTPDGELVPVDAEPERRAHACRNGWLGPESEPAPCPVCKPETVKRLRAQRARAQARAAYGMTTTPRSY